MATVLGVNSSASGTQDENPSGVFVANGSQLLNTAYKTGTTDLQVQDGGVRLMNHATAGATQKWRVAIYEDNGSGHAKTTPVATSIEQTVTSSTTAPANVSFTFPSTVVLTANTWYWLAFWWGTETGSTGGQFHIQVQNGNHQDYDTAVTYASTGNPASTSFASGNTSVYYTLWLNLIPVSGGTTWNGTSLVSLTDTVTTAGKATHFASSTVSLADTVTTAGVRRRFGATTTSLVDTITTAGVRRRFGSSVVALIDTITTSGATSGVKLGTSLVSLVDTITTNGTVPGASEPIVYAPVGGIQISEAGPAGPAGPTGPAGPAGTAGLFYATANSGSYLDVHASGSVVFTNTGSGGSWIEDDGVGGVNLKTTNQRISMFGLPTSDPGVTGALWNSSGDLQISPSSGGGGSAPTGCGADWFTTTPPTGWLLCDGSAISRTTYAALFAVIGTGFGVGDGSTTFNLPDARGRVMVILGTHADVNTLGNNEGSTAANRRPKHPHTNSVTATSGLSASHSLTLPNHGHSDSLNFSGSAFNTANGSDALPNVAASNGGSNVSNANWNKSGGVGNPTSNPAISGSVSLSGGITVGGTIGAAGTATDAPAYLVIQKIIKT